MLAAAGGLLRQDAQIQAHGGHRRRHRLWPRDVRRLSARVRGRRRQDRAEDVPAAHRSRLRDLPGPAQDQHRWHLPRVRRSNGFRWYKQFNEYGMRGKINVVGGMTAVDEAVLRNMGDEVLGTITSCWYSAELDNPINKKFAAAFRSDWKYDPGFYAAATYVEGAVLEAGLEAVKGKIEDKPAFMKALRGIRVETARGPVAFDE